MFEMLSFLFSQLLYFALHIDHTNSFPRPLSPQKERKYFEQMASGDDEARRMLIEHNLRLVAHIIKKYYSSTNDQEDLISIGTIGLIKAVGTFKYEKGTRFATYASRCIENEILMHFRNLKKSAGDVSINDPIETDKDGNSLSLVDIVSDDEDIADQVDLKFKSELLRKLVDQCLLDREREIIVLRYGIGEQKTLTQRAVAAQLGISRSYVSRLEKKALMKLRRGFERSESPLRKRQ